MRKSNPVQVIHRDSSLSAFITGAVLGAAAAIMFGTEEGRRQAKKLVNQAKDLKEKLPEQLPTAAEIIDRLHRQSSSESSAFTKEGKPLK